MPDQHTTNWEGTTMPTPRIEDLAKIGMVYVQKTPEFRAAVAKAMSAWEAFCALPEERKILFPYTADAKASGNGYELKKGSAFDFKENFHLRAETRDWLMENAYKVDDVVTPAFIDSALGVIDALVPVIRQFAEAAARQYPALEPGFVEDVMVRKLSWLLRFLHYFGDRTPGEELAAYHNDKGPFTMHLDESAPGVEYLSFDTREWKGMPLSHDETVIFGGMGLQHRSKCAIRALCHRVVATEETARVGRFASVVFLGVRNMKFFDKARFGSQQEHGAGKFYDTPFEEFDPYFID